MAGSRNILWLLPLGVILFWPLWRGPVLRFLAPGNVADSASVAGNRATDEGQSFSMEGVFFLQLKNGVKNWQIEAARLYTGEDPDRMRLEQVQAQVFQGERRKFRITSQEGEYDNKKKVLALEKDVEVHAEDGYRISAEALNYDDDARNIWTKSPVRITGRSMDVSGQGLLYDLKTGSYDVRGRVKMDVR